ncbi:hypothetical protein Tco_0833178 [Tanacetum coccineum]
MSKKVGVRFIKVSNINVLVGNLNTIWIGKFKLRFNLARFQRGSINGGVKDVEQKQHVRVNVHATSSFSRSFAAAVSNEARPHTIEKNMEDKPAMVIDDNFLLDKNSKLIWWVRVRNELWVDFEGIPSSQCKVSVIRARKIIGWNHEFMEQESETSSDSGNEESEKSTPFTDICS